METDITNPGRDHAVAPEFVAIDGHELLNLVNGVWMHAQLLARHLDGESVARKTRESSNALIASSRRLLDFLSAKRTP